MYAAAVAADQFRAGCVAAAVAAPPAARSKCAGFCWISRAGSKYLYDMTHSQVWYDSVIYVTRLIYMCDVTHSFV